MLLDRFLEIATIEFDIALLSCTIAQFEVSQATAWVESRYNHYDKVTYGLVGDDIQDIEKAVVYRGLIDNLNNPTEGGSYTNESTLDYMYSLDLYGY